MIIHSFLRSSVLFSMFKSHSQYEFYSCKQWFSNFTRASQEIACPRLRDSRVRWIEKAQTRKNNGRKPFFPLDFDASSPLSESLEQAT